MEKSRFYINDKGELVKKIGRSFFKVNAITHFRRKTLVFSYSEIK